MSTSTGGERLSTAVRKRFGALAYSESEELQDSRQLPARLNQSGLVGAHDPVIAQFAIDDRHAVGLEEVDAPLALGRLELLHSPVVVRRAGR